MPLCEKYITVIYTLGSALYKSAAAPTSHSAADPSELNVVCHCKFTLPNRTDSNTAPLPLGSAHEWSGVWNGPPIKVKPLGLITVFDAILTGRQGGQKLQSLYGNPRTKNFFQNRILQTFVNRYVKILGARFIDQV